MKGGGGLAGGLALTLGLALALGSSPLGCRSEAGEANKAGGDRPPPSPTLDLASARASAVDGLEAALADPSSASASTSTSTSAAEVARAFERSFERVLAEPVVVEASERMLARVAQDPQLAPAADRFFIQLQDSEAVRAALVDYAQQNPGLTPSELSQGFVSYVDARLTRPELAALLRRDLQGELARVGGTLGRALMIEAGGAEALAALVLARLERPEFMTALRQRLGDDPQRLARRLGDPQRSAAPLLDFARVMADAPAGHELIAGILDQPTSATLVADSLRHLLGDPDFLQVSRELLAVALADTLDAPALEVALDQLLALTVLRREAATLLGALARLPGTRAAVADYVDRYGQREQLDALLLDALD